MFLCYPVLINKKRLNKKDVIVGNGVKVQVGKVFTHPDR